MLKPQNYWLVPCNIGVYDINKAIRESNGCWWRQGNRFAVGDTVFIYLSKPVQAVRYRMEITAVDVPETEQLMSVRYWVDESTYWDSLGSNRLARFELKERYEDDRFSFVELQKHGLKNHPQSVRTIGEPLQDFLLSQHVGMMNHAPTGDDGIDPAGNPDLGTDYAADDDLWEGAVDKALVNHYERNREAREQCIRLKGCRCAICGFDFEKAYGPIGRNFIHIHHIKPISSIGKDYKLNVARDLIPVCPNCHAMLHSKPGKHDAYTPDELRTMIKNH